MNTRYYAMLGLAVAASLVLAVGAVSSSVAQTNSNSTDADKPSTTYKENKRYREYEDGVFKVRAGAGSHVAPLTQFYPYKAEIKVGETVEWYNPTRVPEPHTVTFVLDQDYWPPLEAPFLIPADTEVMPLEQGSNTDAITMPGPEGSKVIVAANARVYTPNAIGANGTASYLPPNASYEMDGAEKYVNSGLIWPQEMAPEGLPPIDGFSIKFEQAGTYNYICLLHPWMAGTVVVSE